MVERRLEKEITHAMHCLNHGQLLELKRFLDTMTDEKRSCSLLNDEELEMLMSLNMRVRQK
ncbi:hypothetical protein ACE1OE_01250 [Vibrio sp. E150_011]